MDLIFEIFSNLNKSTVLWFKANLLVWKFLLVFAMYSFKGMRKWQHNHKLHLHISKGRKSINKQKRIGFLCVSSILSILFRFVYVREDYKGKQRQYSWIFQHCQVTEKLIQDVSMIIYLLHSLLHASFLDSNYLGSQHTWGTTLK